ncbi:hypothetical protein [Agrococcus jenensis]|uniref:Uncharacterized protein n=1 Tax=Agrococcus jenensis TaxID=46353 RepID=A0A3N2APZ3_9MICO|nr:hypothetical protein [Agrococcus jenensis]ROR65121.1 hypothetical protein EDD26_0483 [Agrococcus jenensis]
MAAARADGAGARRSLGWRHLLVALVAGGLVGAAVVVGIRAADDASAGDPAAVLEATASAYLQAIADGEAVRAVQLSPLGPGRVLAPEAALASATRIEPVAVGPTRVDGARGSVDVRYRVGGAEVQRTLQASLTPAGWRLATSLAEAPDTRYNEPTAVLRVSGVPLPEGGALLLYPGVYRLDVVEGPLFAWGGDAFAVDGDPATPTQVQAARELMPSFQDRLARLGLEVIDACRERPDCPIRTGYDFELAGEISVLEALDDGRTVDLKVPLVARDAAGWEWRDVIVRVRLDSRDLPVELQCSASGTAFEPCGP